LAACSQPLLIARFRTARAVCLPRACPTIVPAPRAIRRSLSDTAICGTNYLGPRVTPPLFPPCDDCVPIEIEIVADGQPFEIFWTLTFWGPSGNSSAGLLSNPTELLSGTVGVTQVCATAGIYEFVIFDDSGNGLCCVGGPLCVSVICGRYSVRVGGADEIVREGGEFGFNETTRFEVVTRSPPPPSPPPSPPPPNPPPSPRPPPSPVGYEVMVTFELGTTPEEFDADAFARQLAIFLNIENRDLVRVSVVAGGSLIVEARVYQVEGAPSVRGALNRASRTALNAVWDLPVLSDPIITSDVPYSPPPSGGRSGEDDGSPSLADSQLPQLEEGMDTTMVVASALSAAFVAALLAALLVRLLRQRLAKQRADLLAIEQALAYNESFNYPLHALKASDFLQLRTLEVFEDMRDRHLHKVIDGVDDARALFGPDRRAKLIFISHQVRAPGVGSRARAAAGWHASRSAPRRPLPRAHGLAAPARSPAHVRAAVDRPRASRPPLLPVPDHAGSHPARRRDEQLADR
jgi:hypothetical protein